MMARLALICSLFISLVAHSAEIPPDLNEWKDWVRYQQEYRNCPALNGHGIRKKQDFLCAWPSKLKIDLTNNQLNFSHTWKVIEESKVPLLGDKALWPQDVLVNSKNATVLENGGLPYLLLPKGEYVISGKIDWQKQPESLSIPAEVALVDLDINGQRQSFIDRRNNRIWLGRDSKVEIKEKDYLKIWANRLISDNHPMSMSIMIELEVGGSGREQKLTQFDLKKYQLKSIHSALNSRIDSQGNLIVQLKPGDHELRLEFKIHNYPQELAFVETGEFWPEQEIWAYQDNQRLRSTQIENVLPIDSNQGIVSEWQMLPHFVLNQNDKFTINERYRGMNHGSDSLSLNRQMWLSFDNSAYYFFDSIRGSKSKDWRVNTIENYRLTQLSNHAQERLVTLDDKNRTGAEVRTPQIVIQASGEVAAKNMQHASGWDIEFANSQVTLNIPPGRKLIAISGADNSSGDWVNQWELIDLFFILITIALVLKSFGIAPAVVALVTLVLSYHERHMPMFLWFNFAVALSLAASIVRPNLLKVLNIYKWVSVGLLLLVLLPFLAEQIRFTLHPQLELSKNIASNDSYSRSVSMLYSEAPAKMAKVKRPRAAISMQESIDEETLDDETKIIITGSRIKRSDLDTSYEQGAIIQAGKGRPDWNWQSARYSWNGPVNGSEAVSIVILPEFAVKILRIAIILFSLLWLLMMLDKNSVLTNLFKKVLNKSSKAAVSTAVLLMVVALPFQPNVQASEIPSDKLLTELRDRLYPVPLCHPDCVSSSAATLTVKDDRLQLSVDFQSGAKVAALIPSSSDWNIESLSINGKPHHHVWKNKVGNWINLNQGQTQLVIKARLKNKSDIAIHFPEQPKQLVSQLDGWEISGVNLGRLVSDSIQLTRDAKTLLANGLSGQGKGQPTAQEQSIADLLFVTRSFTFGTQWELDTSVARQAPQQGAITIQLPLLSVEQPIEMSDKVNGRMMQVVIPRDEHQVSWRSSLSGTSEFELVALDDDSITESWKILVFPNWNIQINGLPAVSPRDTNGDDYWVYQYYPRAGEKLIFSLTKPPAAKGSSIAISKVEQQHTISKRKTTTELTIDYRATRAESILIQLGAAQLKNISHDGSAVNLAKVEGAVAIGLKPGKHQLQLQIESPLEMKFNFKVHEIEIDQPFSNLSTKVVLPENRWLLSASGPGYGPAIVYWGELIFFILLAFGLSRLPFSPLSYLQWLLLGLGMSTFSWFALAGVSVWLLASEWRRQNKDLLSNYKITLSWLTVLFSIFAVLALVAAVPYGLLQSPDMGVMGNDSYGNYLNWFLDQGEQSLGTVSVYTLPLWVYKGLMLLWATWLSVSLIKWLGWIWNDLADAPFRKKRIVAADSITEGKK